MDNMTLGYEPISWDIDECMQILRSLSERLEGTFDHVVLNDMYHQLKKMYYRYRKVGK